jgi:hypothetical protein
MISIKAKKHDNFSVEFKFGFDCKLDGKPDDFAVNAWMFVPNSLDINEEIYGEKQFYRDIKSNIRLITPTYLLRDIAKDDSLPFTLLRRAMEKVAVSDQDADISEYEYHLKMFAAIFKSALRDSATHLKNTTSLSGIDYLVEDYLTNAEQILKKFRALYAIIDVPTVSVNTRNYFRLCDEFVTHIVEIQSIRIVRRIDATAQSSDELALRERFAQMVMAQREYKKLKGYDVLNGEINHDRRLVHHRGMLKKLIESDLYINLRKKKDGVAVEQLMYSIAAGVAMIFATGVAWFTQVKYGNITWPLFVVLVVSYMLKDRIKELMRYYFAHRLGDKYFDKKADICINRKNVGVIKEGFDFISWSRTPHQVRELREQSSSISDETRIFEEKILLYRKHLIIDDKALQSNAEYPMRGINEIMRLHLTRFTQKMDNPTVPIDTFDEDGNVITIHVQKSYYINIVFQLQHDGSVKYHHFRITMTREGVLHIVEL